MMNRSFGVDPQDPFAQPRCPECNAAVPTGSVYCHACFATADIERARQQFMEQPLLAPAEKDGVAITANKARFALLWPAIFCLAWTWVLVVNHGPMLFILANGAGLMVSVSASVAYRTRPFVSSIATLGAATLAFGQSLYWSLTVPGAVLNPGSPQVIIVPVLALLAWHVRRYGSLHVVGDCIKRR